MNKKWIVRIVVPAIAICLLGWAGYEKWKSNKRESRIAAIKEMRASSRCPNKGKWATKTRLIKSGTLIWDKTIEEVLALPGSFLLKKGRHKGARALPLLALLPKKGNIHTIEFSNCYGKSRSFPISRFVNGAKSTILVSNKKNVLKLITKDKNDVYGGRPLTKNIELIKLLP